jgi:ABC-type multidrug transport system permease subunit
VISALTFPFSRPRRHVVAAVVRRDYHVARSYRLPFVLDLFYGVLNLVVFFFISRTFSDASPTNLQGAPDYFAFAAVGIALTIVLAAASSGLASRIREEQLTGTLEALLAQPLTTTEVALGLAGFPFLFAIVRAAFYILLAAALLGLDLSGTDWIGFATVLLVAGVALSALGVLFGALVLVIKRGEVLAGMVATGMGLVSGAFFPVAVLPAWLEPLGAVVPTRFAFDGLRAAIFRGEGWGDDTLALLLFAAVSLPVAIFAFSQALGYARRAGSLGQY